MDKNLGAWITSEKPIRMGVYQVIGSGGAVMYSYWDGRWGVNQRSATRAANFRFRSIAKQQKIWRGLNYNPA